MRFQRVKSSVNGDELARIIIEVLNGKLNVPQGFVLAAMRDRVPVNTKALQTVSVLYPEMLDVGCISRFLDRVGTKCNIPVLKQFLTTWNLIFNYYKYEGKKRTERGIRESHDTVQCDEMAELLGVC